MISDPLLPAAAVRLHAIPPPPNVKIPRNALYEYRVRCVPAVVTVACAYPKAFHILGPSQKASEINMSRCHGGFFSVLCISS